VHRLSRTSPIASSDEGHEVEIAAGSNEGVRRGDDPAMGRRQLLDSSDLNARPSDPMRMLRHEVKGFDRTVWILVRAPYGLGIDPQGAASGRYCMPLSAYWPALAPTHCQRGIRTPLQADP
jgi:hypothetical protein